MSRTERREKLLSERDLNIIRGKALVGHASTEEILAVFEHLDAIEDVLNETDAEDYFGTEGWRHFFGLPDAD